MTDPTLADYALLEQNVARLNGHLDGCVENMRAALALMPGSEDHRLQLLLGILTELKAGDRTTVAVMLALAVDGLAGCTGRHVAEHDEPGVEDWE